MANTIPPCSCFPAESLTHITSFLDPVSLCSLAQANRKLYEHVSDDNTWRRAFISQFLGVSPEDALNEAKALTFRLTEKTWKIEFVRRHIIRGLWSRSKYTVISHRPFYVPISVIHVMADYALLTASTQYGVVARSFPFRNNKVLKGYLYATGIPPGLGNGLPNINFMPNISACVLASDGTTAKVLWGRQDGSVVAVFHPRTMSGTQAPAHILASSARQEHEGAVLDGTWAANGEAFVTAGSDGHVKVWTITPFRCAWTSERHLFGLEIDAILKVAEDLDNGIVVAASRRGDVVLWSGLDASLGAADVPSHNVQRLCIPVHTFPIPDVDSDSVPQPMEISALFLQVSSPTKLSILAYYRNVSRFYRCSVDFLSKQADVKAFGDAASGNIRCIQPAFSNNPAEASFILAGTQLGKISIYDWGTTLLSDLVPASRHVDVFPDAHVTNLAMNPFVIVAGSSRGTIMVLDILTLETLGSFTAPMNHDVRQIELAGDVLVASVGSKVLAWSAGHFSSGGKNPTKMKGKGKHGGHGKWFKQAQLRNDIAEASDLVEGTPLQCSLGAEREQLMQLHALGLSEREAVEYALMLSRDEELARLGSGGGEHVRQEGVFDAEESSRSQSESSPSSPSSSSIRQYSPPPLRHSTSVSSTGSRGHRIPLLASPTSSNVKVQVSPRFYSEPRVAGGLLGSPPDSATMSSQESRSLPSRSSALGPITAPSKQREKRSAWSKPLPGVGLSPRTNWKVEANEDLELRFALEQSLAEAQSCEKDMVGT
ncbi:hypothetical protein F5148DRAFT_977577 [Russula earlei]|uniref:Uncharacterized protein n=1 Tax=Russula earlei TaxID=71964 RepID=A0ACC0UDU2_9AGAM|nr:hypothetical protein F5148DRAFT_977577 [Russula earlei]